jgi:translation initiation factor eIF-2B subunit epsilon
VDSYIWDGAVIENGVSVKTAIICENVVLREGSSVERGCILSYGVVIGKDFEVSAFTKLTKTEEEDEFAEDGAKAGDQPQVNFYHACPLRVACTHLQIGAGVGSGASW